jgi:hypothetical protein
MSQLLEDKQEISELAARYIYAMDHYKPQDWADTFTEDGELRVNGKTVCKGSKARLEFATMAAKTGLKYRRWMSNWQIDVDGDTARLRLYVLAFAINDGITPTVMGEYDDSLVRVGGKWRFQTRHVTFCAGASALVKPN